MQKALVETPTPNSLEFELIDNLKNEKISELPSYEENNQNNLHPTITNLQESQSNLE